MSSGLFNPSKAEFIDGYCWTQYYERYKRELIFEDKDIEKNFQEYVKNNFVIKDEDNKRFFDSLNQHRYGNMVFPNQLDILMLGKFLESTAFINHKDRTFINNLVTMPKVAEKIRIVKSIAYTRYSIWYDIHNIMKPENYNYMSLNISIPEEDESYLASLNLMEKVKLMMRDENSPIFICIPVDKIMHEFIDNFLIQLK